MLISRRSGDVPRKLPFFYSTELGIDHREVSRRIYAMNKRIEEEIITKQGHRWRLIKKLRRDFAAARPRAIAEEMEKSSS